MAKRKPSPNTKVPRKPRPPRRGTTVMKPAPRRGPVKDNPPKPYKPGGKK